LPPTCLIVEEIISWKFGDQRSILPGNEPMVHFSMIEMIHAFKSKAVRGFSKKVRLLLE
jgi:hypothetical protein